MNDWNNPFKPTDFPETYTDLANETAAREANKRFRELLAECPKVYGKMSKHGHAWSSEKIRSFYDTHEARLIAIKEIQK